jgi:hypothetical protein
MDLTVDNFKNEIAEALKVYDKYIVCVHKTPDKFEESLASLVKKAIEVYNAREPNLRHGIALDKEITVILSQTDVERPLCGIYFNLHTPYRKNGEKKSKAPVQ